MDGLSTSFLVPLVEYVEGVTSGWGVVLAALTHSLFSLLPSRAGRAWDLFSSGPLGMVEERGTTAPVMATPTASTPSL